MWGHPGPAPTEPRISLWANCHRVPEAHMYLGHFATVEMAGYQTRTVAPTAASNLMTTTVPWTTWPPQQPWLTLTLCPTAVV